MLQLLMSNVILITQNNNKVVITESWSDSVVKSKKECGRAYGFFDSTRSGNVAVPNIHPAGSDTLILHNSEGMIDRAQLLVFFYCRPYLSSTLLTSIHLVDIGAVTTRRYEISVWEHASTFVRHRQVEMEKEKKYRRKGSHYVVRRQRLSADPHCSKQN